MQKFHNHQTIILLLVLPSAAAPWMQEEDLLVFQQLAVRLNGWAMDDVALPCSSFLFFINWNLPRVSPLGGKN